MRPFEHWTYEEVENEFGLTDSPQLDCLREWLDTGSIEVNDPDRQHLEKLRQRLAQSVDDWNEDELKMLFIAPLLDLANLESRYFKQFSQRTLSVHKGGVVLASGKVDFLLASGKVAPKQPYFCLHEYKPQKHRDSNPRGQVLIAMVAAQEKNDPELPVYGVYVVGRLWFFMALEGMQYAVGKSFDTTDEANLLAALRVLRKGRLIIEAHVAAMTP